jgi:hypothetical protein
MTFEPAPAIRVFDVQFVKCKVCNMNHFSNLIAFWWCSRNGMWEICANGEFPRSGLRHPEKSLQVSSGRYRLPRPGRRFRQVDSGSRNVAKERAPGVVAMFVASLLITGRAYWYNQATGQSSHKCMWKGYGSSSLTVMRQYWISWRALEAPAKSWVA